MIRKLLLTMLVLFVAAGMINGKCFRVSAATVELGTWDEVEHAMYTAASNKTPITIQLNGNISDSSPNNDLVIGNGGKVTLDLAGHSIDGENIGTIQINAQGALTIIDSVGTGTITGLSRGIQNSGRLTIEGGTITNNSNDSSGGGIVNHGSGILLFRGGAITNNTGNWGGGIYNEGKLTFENGTISGNKANSYGGGVWNLGTMEITGGTISGNKRVDTSLNRYSNDLCSLTSDQTNEWKAIDVSGPLKTGSNITISTNVAGSPLATTLPPKTPAWVITDGYKFTDAPKSGFVCDTPDSHIIALDYQGNIILRKADSPSLLVMPAGRGLLFHTGSAQQLVIPGDVNNGTLKYAVTTENKEPSDSQYSTAIPTGTDVGTYYVWYKVDDPEYYNKMKRPDSIPVLIASKNTVPIDPNKNPGGSNSTPEGSNSTSRGSDPSQGGSETANDNSETKQETKGSKPVHILNLRGKQTRSKVTLSWKSQKDASMYKVYGAYCGEKIKLLKTIKNKDATKATITELNGKSLDLKKTYKFRIVAYKDVKGKPRELAGSFFVHIAGRKNANYSDVKTVKVRKRSLKLKKGQTSQINPKFVLVDKNKKPMDESHAARFRFKSSSKAVAAVNKHGKITAKNPGSCTIYVYAINGVRQKINVSVN